MKTYNKIMLKFWLATAIVILIGVTYMGFTEGFKKWGFYYVVAGIAFLSYFMRKMMMKRQEKHEEFLANQKKENE
ncbi:MAG TPA: hypothetical protein EYG86_09720 [Crocinitomicaceae bacterium]|nr:hypothetical protein [Crocinitomicaceae bacterium]